MTHRLRSFLALAGPLAATLVALALVLPSAPSSAQRRGRRGLRCQAHLTQARIPRSLSEQGLIGFARRNRARRLRETSDENLNDRTWLANAVFAFNRPINDLEFHVLFYDVHDGPRVFLSDLTVFMSARDQRTILHRLELPRPRFRPNRRYELVVTVRRQEVGRVRFETVGEEPRRTGQVDFTQDNEP